MTPTDYLDWPFVINLTENNHKSIPLSVMKKTCRATAFNLGTTKLTIVHLNPLLHGFVILLCVVRQAR